MNAYFLSQYGRCLLVWNTVEHLIPASMGYIKEHFSCSHQVF